MHRIPTPSTFKLLFLIGLMFIGMAAKSQIASFYQMNTFNNATLDPMTGANTLINPGQGDIVGRLLIADD